MNAKISISVLHFDLSQETRQQIQQTVQDLFAHDYVSRIDVTVEGEYQQNTRILYNVTLRAQLREEVLFELNQGEQLLPTLQAATSSLDRRVRQAPSVSQI